MAPRRPAPIHPGEVVQEEFLKPLALSQHRLAKELSVPPRRIIEIVLGKRGITADTALRLARFFGTSARFWLDLQTSHDLAMEEDRLRAGSRARSTGCSARGGGPPGASLAVAADQRDNA